MSRLELYNNLLSNATTAQYNASICSGARSGSCATVQVRSYITNAISFAQAVGESSVANQLVNLNNNYNSWSWAQISHEMTNILNAIRPAVRAAESGNAADVARAEAARRLSVETGTNARIQAQQEADRQVAARNAATAASAQEAERIRQAEAQRRVEQQRVDQARAAAQAELQQAAAAERAAADRAMRATSERERQAALIAQRQAEATRIAAQRQQQATQQAQQAQQAQHAQQRQTQTQQVQGPSGPSGAQQFQTVATGIGTILNPLANLFSQVAQQRVAGGAPQFQQQQQQFMPSSFPQPAAGSNTGIIIAAAAGGGVLLLLLLFLALR